MFAACVSGFAYKTNRKKKTRSKTERVILLFCQNKMPCKDHIDQVDKTENPAPANNHENNENNDVNNRFRAKHNGQSNKNFHNPTNKRKDKKNYFKQSALLVKPSIKIHKTLQKIYLAYAIFCYYYITVRGQLSRLFKNFLVKNL